MPRGCHRAGLAASRLVLTLHPAGGGDAGSRPETRRSAPLPATADPAVWRRIARDLLDRTAVPPLDRLGVTLTGLVPADQVQAALF
ncbi:DinB/UmuC family translesion DNA polymerase [Nakamurella leprariae]|uniref:DNA polymerase Y-family little finger domain-containing protein n=1 Tax=Nakamurella leprariae TaxID=2803911 RepID=A0A938YHT5_9ACTN|nr:hypothetical protein [Nakamurella leprariae]MBM9468404.1 hypothetical protein [Nakamurella leprariae]